MAIGTERGYLKLRLIAISILLLHLGVRLAFKNPSPFADLILFNSAAFLAAAVAFSAPLFNDQLAVLAFGWAFVIWGVGSTISTWNSFYVFQIWPLASEITYSLFYPLVLFALLRALTSRSKPSALELLDIVIITFGMSSLIASFFLKTAMLHFVGSQTTVFLSILYPVGDVVLLAIAVVIVVLQVKVLRSFLFLLGITIFTATDLIFLWKSATTGYAFASLIDDGWLLGLLIMAEALWHRGGEAQMSDRITSIAATIALIFSSTILITAAVQRGFFPAFALIPAIITIALAFIRMGIALREARSASQDRELARIDELTGLANRRRFLAEIDALTPLDGTLLLMDLDGFKSVNDTLGHSVGDELLQHIAVRFSRVVPADALLARLGGDEFGVIVHGGAQAGLDIALALRSSLSYPFHIGTSSISVDVSIGRVINDGKADLMRRADIAMYQAKNSGGGVALWKSEELI